MSTTTTKPKIITEWEYLNYIDGGAMVCQNPDTVITRHLASDPHPGYQLVQCVIDNHGKDKVIFIWQLSENQLQVDTAVKLINANIMISQLKDFIKNIVTQYEAARNGIDIHKSMILKEAERLNIELPTIK